MRIITDAKELMNEYNETFGQEKSLAVVRDAFHAAGHTNYEDDGAEWLETLPFPDGIVQREQ